MPQNNQSRQNPCPAWLWLILLAGLVILYFVYNHAISEKAPWIQQDIQSRLDENYTQQTNFKAVNTSVDGRDVTLQGSVASQEISDQAEQIAQQTFGTRVVNNQLEIMHPEVTIETEETTTDLTPEQSRPLANVEPLPEEFAPLDVALEETVDLVEDTAKEAITVEAAQATVAKEKFSQLDFSNITFEKNSTELTTKAQSTLDLAATALTENPTVNINVNGHTDSSGNPELNLKLSKQRAQAVLEYFANKGIESNRMNANGYGDQFPIAPNDTQAGRIMNRRIEIKVINGE